MKEHFFDIVVILMMLVATGVKTNNVTGVEQPPLMWTLEEASFLGDTTLTQSANHSIVQAVTRENEGNEHIFRCGIHDDD
jgi:hypothetical protein